MKLQIGDNELDEPAHYQFRLDGHVLTMVNYFNPEVKAIFPDGKDSRVIPDKHKNEVKKQLQENRRATT